MFCSLGSKSTKAAAALLGPALFLALLLPAAPAQASEVVKLARLVITGKRLSATQVAKPPAPKPELLSQRGDGDDEGRRSQFRPI